MEFSWVDLVLIAIFTEHSTLGTHTVDPDGLGWVTSITASVSLTSTSVAAETLSSGMGSYTAA
jgi:hypothetical protein